MSVLPRVFFTMTEVVARWGCSPADVAGWAHLGQLELITGITPVICGDTQMVGLVAVSVTDILPMFRRTGEIPEKFPIRRIRAQGEADWRLITEPAEGILVSMDGLLITSDAVRRFETEYEILGRTHGGRGPEPKYDWDAFWRAVVVRVYEHGVPETLKEFTDELSDWFMTHSPTGSCPSDSVIRKRLSPLWHELRREE